MPSLNDEDNPIDPPTLPVLPSTHPIAGAPKNCSIDLNRVDIAHSSSSVDNEDSSFSQEAARTIEVGKMLGFQIEVNDPILREAMGAGGENTGEKMINLDLKQKSRIKWAVDGDENTRFFHGFVNNKRRKSRINGLVINGEWNTKVEDIKQEAYMFFRDKFHEKWPSRPKLINSRFRKLEPDISNNLEEEFSLEEVKRAVWDCGNEKAPGPDGFSFAFIKKYWDNIKDDFMAFVKRFERFGRIGKGCNSSFITLVPKVKDPLNLGDFRPISLIGCMYKIIAKSLANRLKRVVGLNIDEVQTAFVEGRNILDGPLIVNEICSWAKKVKKKILLFKVDFDKTFDSINWEYLDSLLWQMGYGNKWRMWIHGCLQSARASVIINGPPTAEFSMSKGVRQGDPLSPFLFILAMEGLNVAMKEVCEKGLFTGIKVPHEDVSISHLFYADDALFLGEWSLENIKNLARVLRCFHVVSGLKVNFNKSRVFGIGVDSQEVSRWASPLGCEPASLPFTYLGVPVGANMNLKKHWKPIIDKFSARLSAWKAKALSFGGRLTLSQAVLGNLPTYYFSLFVAPIGVIKTLERIRRNFLWGGDENNHKIKWVKWEKVVAPKDKGGLGLGSLKALNIALITKWWWRLRSEKTALWSRVIKGIHNLTNKPAEYLAKKSIPGVWSNVARVNRAIELYGINMKDIFTRKVGKGNDTLFWLDSWIGDCPLKDKFPNIFQLEKKKRCKVEERVRSGHHLWDWKARPTSSEQVSNLNALVSLLGLFQPNQSLDQWTYALADDGKFHVDVLRHKLDSLRVPSPENVVMWTHEVPKKVMCFVWRAYLRRIPSATGLHHRGVHVSSVMCGYCLEEEECSRHILFQCPFAGEVWYWIFKWCEISHNPFGSIGDLLNFISNYGACNEKRKTLLNIMYGESEITIIQTTKGPLHNVRREHTPPHTHSPSCSRLAGVSTYVCIYTFSL
ncbi:hypothetical protein L1887_16430 [Cichorium endivia]|nr:hypothetical protein L1887_16430 [Cichorium endivia]